MSARPRPATCLACGQPFQTFRPDARACGTGCTLLLTGLRTWWRERGADLGDEALAHLRVALQAVQREAAERPR